MSPLVALLRPPLPCWRTAVAMDAEPGYLRLRLLVDIVAAVPHERPSHAIAHHDGAEILARRPADGDDAAVAVGVLRFADDGLALDEGLQPGRR